MPGSAGSKRKKTVSRSGADVYDSSGRATSHGVMWTGKDWRSDCIQRALSCYPGGKDRDGNYSVCIWRMPSLVSEGLGINNTPNLT